MSRGKPTKRARDRRREKQRRERMERLKQRVAGGVEGRKVTFGDARDAVKMSDVLERFVEPYMEYAETEDAYRKLLATGMAAWNLALMPEVKRQANFDKVLALYPAGVRRDARGIIEEMMERKERYFLQYRRMILGFEVADEGNRWHLSVISMAEPV